MSLKPTRKSLDIVEKISKTVPTFHHHYHILYDIADTFKNNKINYLEIGAYAGGSSCFMLQRENTNVISIDLGNPIPKVVVLENIINHKNNNNYYKYIEGDSQTLETKNKVIQFLLESKELGFDNLVDILFIDGDHSFNGLINDFTIYNDLVKVGGYIVFDDYRDDVHSAEVRQAVDSLLPNLLHYEIIGTLNNDLEAYPNELKEGNCFIIKKIK
jgi:predicted O-methyltransferase YrrM